MALTTDQVIEILLNGGTVWRGKGEYKLDREVIRRREDDGEWRQVQARTLCIISSGIYTAESPVRLFSWECAANHMKDGGQVKRSKWPLELGAWYTSSLGIIRTLKHFPAISLEDLEAKDWILIPKCPAPTKPCC